MGFLGCILGTMLGGRGAEEERRTGLQTSYDEIYVRANTGFSNIEEEIQQAAPEQDPQKS
jgi:cation/acetate symporter